MLDLISETWKTNKMKVLLVAIPVIGLLLAAIFLSAYRDSLISSAKKLMGESEAKDAKLTQEAAVANAQAEDHKAAADALAVKAEAVSKEDDADWNKKV